MRYIQITLADNLFRVTQKMAKKAGDLSCNIFKNKVLILKNVETAIPVFLIEVTTLIYFKSYFLNVNILWARK